MGVEISAEELEIIHGVVNKIARKYKFGYYSIEDIKQEAYIEAMKGIEKWDRKRPLENFIYIHIRNRLSNLKRDKFARPDKPCLSCPLWDKATDGCNKYNDKMECNLYDGWYSRNNAKRSLMSVSAPVEGDNAFSYESTFNIAEFNELFALIDPKIPVDSREDWIRLVYNLKLPKARREAIIIIVRNILGEQNDD